MKTIGSSYAIDSARVGVDTAWQTLTSFAIYRLVVVIILTLLFWTFGRFQVIGGASPLLAAMALAAHFALGIGCFVTVRMRVPAPGLQLAAQVFVDVLCLTLLMHASGGVRSGIGMMLLVTLAASGLVSRGRIAFFYAAVAAIAVLIEQSWQFLHGEQGATEFLPAGILAGSFFVMAGLAYTLAKYARGAEQIAAERTVDLANLAQINELVIRDMHDGFVVVDEQGVVRQHNPQSATLVPSLAGAIGRPLAEAVPALAERLQTWRQERRGAQPIVRDADSRREYQARFVAIGEGAESGQGEAFVIFIEDASRLRAQAKQLKLAALGRLTASIAHEIRNPLSSINHAAELLQEDAARNDADQRLLTIIRDNAHRLDRMVEEVLYLNRRDRAHPETLDAAGYLAQFVRDFSGNEKRDPAGIALTVTGGLTLRFDRAHLDQILWNLVRNACRYASTAPAAVRIAASMQDDAVRIDVRDDGPGVAAEAVPHLFEPFFTTDSQGTGLGLYIARELAEVNGARLEYVADNRSGACFRLTCMPSHTERP